MSRRRSWHLPAFGRVGVLGAAVCVAACSGSTATKVSKPTEPFSSTASGRQKLDPRAVVTAFRGNEPSLQACFELGGNRARGALTMGWLVDEGGTASRAHVVEARVADPIRYGY
jgi:hypothetical protein